jgi:hypothetical protein
MNVWDGLTPTRKDLGTSKAAGFEDYLVIVQKIQELESYCLNLTDNIQVMPNLDETLQEAKLKIDSLQDLIERIHLPQDVKDQLAAFEEILKDVDQRVETCQLRRDLESLKERVVRNQIEVLQLQNSFATEVKGFQNKIWGQLQKLQTETTGKIAILEEKVRHIDAQVDLQASIEKMSKLTK